MTDAGVNPRSSELTVTQVPLTETSPFAVPVQLSALYQTTPGTGMVGLEHTWAPAPFASEGVTQNWRGSSTSALVGVEVVLVAPAIAVAVPPESRFHW